MAFQFQSVAALTPQIAAETGLGFVAIGTLSGAYLLPGVIAALFGGWAGQRFGDIRIALCGLTLMAAGGFAGAFFVGFELQVCARLLAGIGAVALNVMSNKMAGDCFEGRADLPVAMSLLVCGWPAGLALAGFALPMMSLRVDFSVVALVPAILCVLAFVLLALTWQTPAAAVVSRQTGVRLSSKEALLISISGVIWGLYNVAFISTITWIPLFLTEGGRAPEAASRLGTVLSSVTIISVALGGWLVAPGGGRAFLRSSPDTVALGSFFGSAFLLCLLIFAIGEATSGLGAALALLGALIGCAAGMIMTLPIEATRMEVRAIGLGLYWAIYYACMGVGPSLLGAARDRFGSASSPLFLACGLLVLCMFLWGVFRFVQRRAAP